MLFNFLSRKYFLTFIFSLKKIFFKNSTIFSAFQSPTNHIQNSTTVSTKKHCISIITHRNEKFQSILNVVTEFLSPRNHKTKTHQNTASKNFLFPRKISRLIRLATEKKLSTEKKFLKEIILTKSRKRRRGTKKTVRNKRSEKERKTTKAIVLSTCAVNKTRSKEVVMILVLMTKKNNNKINNIETIKKNKKCIKKATKNASEIFFEGMCFSLVLNYSSLRYLGHDINTKHIPSGEKYKMIQKINSIFSIFHVIITYLMSSFTSTITITIIKLNTKKVLLTYHYNEANDLKKFFEQIKSHNTLIKLKESLKRASKTDKNTFKSDVSQIAAASDENSARKKTRQKQQKTLKNQQLQQLSQQQPQQLQQKSQQLQQQQPSQKTAYSLKTYPETHKTLRQEFSIKKPQNPKAIKAGFKTTFIIFLLFSIHPSSSSSCSRDHWKSQATRCSYVLNEMTENLKTTWKQDGQTGVHRKTHTQTNEETIKQLCRCVLIK